MHPSLSRTAVSLGYFSYSICPAFRIKCRKWVLFGRWIFFAIFAGFLFLPPMLSLCELVHFEQFRSNRKHIGYALLHSLLWYLCAALNELICTGIGFSWKQRTTLTRWYSKHYWKHRTCWYCTVRPKIKRFFPTDGFPPFLRIIVMILFGLVCNEEEGLAGRIYTSVP